jgi:hypothetical protein
LKIRFVSTQTKKADSSHLSPTTIERKRERDLRRINDTEKREEKKKKHRKAVLLTERRAHKRTKNKIFASFFHNPKVERMS